MNITSPLSFPLLLSFPPSLLPLPFHSPSLSFPSPFFPSLSFPLSLHSPLLLPSSLSWKSWGWQDSTPRLEWVKKTSKCTCRHLQQVSIAQYSYPVKLSKTLQTAAILAQCTWNCDTIYQPDCTLLVSVTVLWNTEMSLLSIVGPSRWAACTCRHWACLRQTWGKHVRPHPLISNLAHIMWVVMSRCFLCCMEQELDGAELPVCHV